jgi:1-deoxy-D-xylulose-5-phosphate synthase
MQIIPIGKGRKLREGEEIAVLSIGAIGNNVAKAVEKAAEKGVFAAHYDLLFLKPIDEELLKEIAENYTYLITVENGVITGGMGSAVLEFLAAHHYTDIHVRRLGIKDEFVTHGTINELRHLCGIDEDGILEAIMETNETIKKSTKVKLKQKTFNPLNIKQNKSLQQLERAKRKLS